MEERVLMNLTPTGITSSRAGENFGLAITHMSIINRDKYGAHVSSDTPISPIVHDLPLQAINGWFPSFFYSVIPYVNRAVKTLKVYGEN